MIKDLEEAIGYHFQNISLLQNALAHSSYANERWHNSLLSNERLEFLGDSILGMLVAEYLLGHGEEQGGGRTRDSILADAVESVIAASFLDGGIQAAKKFIQTFILVEVPVSQLHNVDYKTKLQELVQQKKNQVLTYELTAESGPDHDKHFSVAVSLNGTVVGQGEGTSKKRAEQESARDAIGKLFPKA